MTNSYNTTLAQIGGRIYLRREELGLSGAELSIRADMPASTLSKIENGRRNIGVETICAIAKALEVPLSRLQPEELDVFSEIEPEMLGLTKKLQLLSGDRKALMLAMFNAQIDVLLDSGR